MPSKSKPAPMPEPADAPARPTPAQAPAPQQLALTVAQDASAGAPFIYFEEVPTFGHMSGIIRLTLDAIRIYPGDQPNTVKTDRVLVAHLRTNLMGARMLRDALDKALLMANPPESESRN